MLVQVNTDNHIEGSADLATMVENEVTTALARFGDQITRVEVHVNDVNSEKKAGVDIRCQMEARLSGLKPISVTEVAVTVEEAVRAAAETMERMLDKTIDKLSDRKGNTSYGGDQTI